MSNLTKPNKITVGGGLHARIREADLLKEAIKIDLTTYPNRLAIICDFSGSMGYYESDRKSKLRLLSEAVQDFALRSNPADTAVAVESFPSGFRIDLTNEYTRAAMDFSLSYLDLKISARTSLEHSFLPGASLWQKPDVFVQTVAACSGQPLGAASPTPKCLCFLQSSEKAAEQWQLEHRYEQFESSLP